MSRLPRISGRDCAKVLNKIGFYQRRQHGGHLILRQDNPFAQVVVPTTKNEIKAPCEASSKVQELE